MPSEDTLRKAADAALKVIPSDSRVRRAIREAAARNVRDKDRTSPPDRATLEEWGRQALKSAGLSDAFLGFAMISLSNEFWIDQFAHVPPGKRVLFLPHCLRKSDGCTGSYDGNGLICRGCGRCPIDELVGMAGNLGYRTIVAEGTPSIVRAVTEGDYRAVLGVACVDSLEKSFRPVFNLGVPCLAVPLLGDGCRDTSVETELVSGYIRLRADGQPAQSTRSYLPLLKYTRGLFGRDPLTELLAEAFGATANGETERTAFDCVLRGGKRFRPFMTLAAYAVLAIGRDAIDPETERVAEIPRGVRQIAVGIEALHKASLVHDDIEDEDEYRYGEKTVHARHGVPVAVNVGDYLVGLGYRLAAEADGIDFERRARIAASLASAHQRLSGGQGAELFHRLDKARVITPLEALEIAAQKTAPAFEAALCAGISAADPTNAGLTAAAVFSRYTGIAYQIKNDLDNLRPDVNGKLAAGGDALLGQPTILKAFALEGARGDERKKILAPLENFCCPERAAEGVRKIYAELGATEKAGELFALYRARALEIADATGDGLGDLLRYIVNTVL